MLERCYRDPEIVGVFLGDLQKLPGCGAGCLCWNKGLSRWTQRSFPASTCPFVTVCLLALQVVYIFERLIKGKSFRPLERC